MMFGSIILDSMDVMILIRGPNRTSKPGKGVILISHNCNTAVILLGA